MDIEALIERREQIKSARAGMIGYRKFIAEGHHADFLYPPARHHELMIDALEELVLGDEWDALLIMAPPGSAKSTYGSVQFSTWAWAIHPQWNILCCSNTDALAKNFARRRRSVCEMEEWQVLSETKLDPAQINISEFANEVGGQVFARGAGSSIAGIRCNLLISDDLIASFEEASSPGQLDKLWEWYGTDARTRLVPDGKEVMIMCMTGDTPVLMASGKECPLENLKVGDKVATYDNGHLSITTVNNWRSSGVDSIYKIQTQSGKIVRANERHPFLVDNHGKPEWTRLKDLKVGDSLVSLKDATSQAKTKQKQISASAVMAENYTAKRILTRLLTLLGITVNGKGFPAQNVIDQQQQKVCAESITSKRILPSVILRKIGKGALNTATASLWTNMMQWCRNSMGYALSALILPQRAIPALIGMGNSASTTATRQERSEDYSATTVTSQLDMGKPQKHCNGLQFTSDKIVSITPDGKEEVFDVEIDRTENFIANGIVSHNTRWSRQDPIGRILERMENGEEPKRVKVLRLPMLCDDPKNDPMGRKLNEPLWPEWFSNAQIADNINHPLRWPALYQQVPIDASGTWVDHQYIQVINAQDVPKNVRHICAMDLALSNKSGDYTVIVVAAIDEDRNIYIVDMHRDQVPVSQTLRRVSAMCKQYHPNYVLIDDDPAAKVFVESMKEYARGTGDPVQLRPMPIRGNDKEYRAAPIRDLFMQNRVFIVQSGWTAEIMREVAHFPPKSKTEHDDIVDCLGLIGRDMGMQASPHSNDMPVTPPIEGAYTVDAAGRLFTTKTLDDMWADQPKSGRFEKLRI